MASISTSNFLLLFLALSFSICPATVLAGNVVEDLVNLKPPPDFNTTIMANCLNNPSLRYCHNSSMDLNEIFKFTIVASHLCNESKNPSCVESFYKIDLRNRPKIAPLYLYYDFFWKYCPLSIISIDLSNSSLNGIFPANVLFCTQIQALDLSLNGLTGDFPVDGISSLENLTFLNLSFNQFSESKISDFEFFKRFNASSFLHSGLLPSNKNYKIKAILILIGFPLSVILLVCWLVWLCFHRPDYLPGVFGRTHKFTPSMLKAATKKFSRKNLVVKSSEGVDIYKGRLRDGTEVRIEIYWGEISRDNRWKFVEECKVLGQLRHKNLVQVLGWCNDRKMRAIVTEWTGTENVEIWLIESAPPWKQRLKVLIGVVEGMCYLQDQWPEVSYDLRTCSVLLSHNLEPLVSRFKIEDQNRNNKKIYKLGVFLLEMITNRRPKEEFENGEAGFIEYIRMNYPGNLQNVIDVRMRLSENMFDQAKHGISLGLMCTDQSSTKYPSLNWIADVITTAYESCEVLMSHDHRRSNGDGGTGHKGFQSR